MDDRRSNSWERFGPLSGIAAVLFWIVGFLLFLTTEVDGAEGAAEILAGYEEDETRIWIAAWLFVLGCALFLWFLGALRNRLLAGEGVPGYLTPIAFAGGIATAVFLMGLPSGDLAATLADDLEPAAAQALHELGTVFFFGAEFSALVLVLATGLIALRTGALPRWFGWVSLALAVLLAIAPIGWLGLVFAFPLWVLLASWLLWQRGEGAYRESAQAA